MAAVFSDRFVSLKASHFEHRERRGGMVSLLLPEMHALVFLCSSCRLAHHVQLLPEVLSFSLIESPFL